MKRVKFLIMTFSALLTLCIAPAWAGPLTEQIKVAINKVIRILEDPALKPESKTKERRAAIRVAANEIFDFAESAKRSLSRHWQERTAEEREEFIKLFGDLLERAYISQIEHYGGEKIVFTGESVDGNQATVKTKITTKSGTVILIDYRMLLRGDRFLIYDVSFDGVSLIANYRNQFNKIIQTSPYQELIKKMKSKLEELAAGKDRTVPSPGQGTSVPLAAAMPAPRVSRAD